MRRFVYRAVCIDVFLSNLLSVNVAFGELLRCMILVNKVVGDALSEFKGLSIVYPFNKLLSAAPIIFCSLLS